MLNVYVKVILNNVSKEERKQLFNYLEENCWEYKKLGEENGILKGIPIDEDEEEYCMVNVYIKVILNNVSREERQDLFNYLEENSWEYKKFEEENGTEKEIPIDEDEYCECCGEEMKNFMHNCPESSDMPEIYGCPTCDDKCGFCSSK